MTYKKSLGSLGCQNPKLPFSDLRMNIPFGEADHESLTRGFQNQELI